MTPEELYELNQALKTIPRILYKNTPSEGLQDFEAVELAVRDHMLETVGPELGNFFDPQQVKHKVDGVAISIAASER
jgi:hypothetical protein